MKTRILSEGDKGKAICEQCAAVATTTYRYRDVPFSDGHGHAAGILAGVCDTCDTVLSIPAQSTPAIQRARNVANQSIEANLPAPYLDALDLACFIIDPGATTEFRKKLLSFYLHKFATGYWDINAASAAALAFTVRKDVQKRRLSMKVSKNLADDFSRMVDASKMSKTALLKAMVGEIKRQIVDGEDHSMLGELRTLAYLG